MKRHDIGDTINFTKLQQEFHTAKQADEKYSRENDAKFRAVHQKVGSYEEFRDIVAASHLKSLDRHEDITGSVAGVKQPWNRLCSRGNDPDINLAPNSEVSLKPLLSLVNMDAIKSRDDFLKAWKTLQAGNDVERIVAFLTGFERNFLIRVFESDIPMDFMETAVKSMNRCFSVDDSNRKKAFVNVLYAFTQSKRFSLSLKFLGKQGKENVLELLRKLKADHDSVEMVDELMECFNL